MHIAFGVLHYGNAETTKACVSSLLELAVPEDARVSVVIVDNASPDKSGELLRACYSGNRSVTVILSEENLGFAKGNNLAYRFIRERAQADFAIILNNDTLIVQKDFLSVLLEEHRRDEHAAVISPDIFDPDVLQHQSPLCTMEEMPRFARAIAEANPVPKGAKALEQRFRLLVKALGRKVSPVRRMLDRRAIRVDASVEWEERAYNIVPQGAAVIFAPEYLKSRQLAFVPVTFLYFEECLLAHECMKAQLSTVYTPRLQVIHKHYATHNGAGKKETLAGRRASCQAIQDSYRQLCLSIGS